MEVPAGSPEVAVPSKKMGGAMGLVRPGFEFSSNIQTQFPYLQNRDHNIYFPKLLRGGVSKIVSIQYLNSQ